MNLIKVQVGESDYQELEIDIDKGSIDIGNLSGLANNGSTQNITNYKQIHFSIGPLPDNVKSELKSMYFYLEYNEEESE